MTMKQIGMKKVMNMMSTTTITMMKTGQRLRIKLPPLF